MKKSSTFFVCTVLILLLTSCKKDPSLWEIKNLNHNTVSIFGHGGMGIASRFPMDSYESIQKCLSIGAEGCEIDVQMSRDSVLFAFHHDKLEDGSSCEGRVCDKLASEIDCQYTSFAGNNREVIRLKNLFEKLGPTPEKTLTFECKLKEITDESYLNAFANVIIKQVHAFSENVCFVESSIPEFLTLLRMKDSSLKLFLYTSDFEWGLSTAKTLNLYGLTIDMFKINHEQIQRAHAQQLRVTLFNQQKEQDNLDAIGMSPDFIQTDKLEHILKVFDKYEK